MQQNVSLQEARTMKKKLLTLLTVPLILFTATLGHGDDTEIYINDFVPESGAPLVMIMLDFRSNLTSTQCQSDNKDEVGVANPDHICHSFFYDDAGNKMIPNVPLDDTDVNFGEVLLGALRKVLFELIEDPEVGENVFKLGLMMNHNAGDLVGPLTEPLAAKLDAKEIRSPSNGGFVFQGFNLVNEKFVNEFVAKLAGLNTPEMNAPTTTNHTFQGAELWFEFFRYLTGQGVYNGHNGFNDYNSADELKNIGYTEGFYPASGTALPGLILPDTPEDFTDPQLGWDATIETNYVGSSSIVENKKYTYSDTESYTYVSPLTENCTNVYALNFLHQVSQQEVESNDAIAADPANGGLGIPIEELANNLITNNVLRTLNDNYFDDGSWGTVDNLGSAAKVTSYFFTNDKINTTTNGYAVAGGTGSARRLADDPDEMVEQLKAVIKEILSVSTTFVSATVPVNVFNRSESLDNVFFGIFEAEDKPQWPGNVKRLRLRVFNDVLQVVDASCPSSTPDDTACTEAISSVDGRISHSSLTYWTDASSFDVTSVIGTVIGRRYNGYSPVSGEVGGKDGRSVDRGGAGQQILGFSDDAPSDENSDGKRQLFTEPASQANGTANTLAALDGDATTAELLWDELCPGVKNKVCDTVTVGADTWYVASTTSSGSDPYAANDQEAAINLLKFARGIDVYNRDDDYNDDSTPNTTDSRPWLFADILHAQPAPLNYGATACASDNPTCNTGGYDVDNPELYILTASNDGYFRMIKNDTSDSTPDGDEMWAFMPREVMPILSDLMGDATAVKHPYGVDGAISIYTEGNETDGTIKSADGDKAIAYFGLRRGGYCYYALDISSPTSPKMLWKQCKTSGGDFDELGQSWSRPRIRTMIWEDTNNSGTIDSNDDSGTVVIFGGGYDTTKDEYENLLADGLTEDGAINDDNGYTDDEGNALFIVNALNGELIWKAVAAATTPVNGTAYVNSDLKDSIPSDVTPVDSDGDGLVDMVYVGDTGGVIWRADFPLGDTGNWTITPILSVGRHAVDENGDSLDLPDRRIFHRPDIVPAENSAGTKYFAVQNGTGNRPFPRQEFEEDDEYDQFYSLKDFNTTPGTPPALLTPADLADVTDATSDTLETACTADAGSTECTILDALRAKGWYFSLINDNGEKLLASAVTFFGKTTFSTYDPSDGGTNQCSPAEGVAYSYVVSLEDGAPVHQFGGVNATTIAQDRSTLTGSGIPGDPVVIALDGKIFITPGNIPNVEEFRNWVAENPLRKTYWYESSE
jgi:type IV pilus assembly protein PilY1